MAKTHSKTDEFSPDSSGLQSAVQPGMQALVRGLRILDLIAEARAPMRFTTLLEGSGLPKGTLHRTLQTLIDERYVQFSERDQAYALGARPFQLAHRVWDQFDLKGAAEPELLRLSALSNEAARLGIMDGGKVLYIDQRDTPHQIKLANGVGARAAVHAAALGKAMAAHMSAFERRALISDPDLTAYTDQTIVQSGDLDQQLNIIKARGYAISQGEQHDDVNAVAAPILDHRARPIGAVGIVGPAYRLPEEKLHALGRDVIEAARRIAGNVGELAMSIAVNPRPLMVVSEEVDVAVPGTDFLAEGPFWDVTTQQLHWVDILAPAVISSDPTTAERTSRPMPELVGLAIPKQSGGFICATETGLRALQPDGSVETLAEPEVDRPGNRFNDGKCDAKGRLWVGSLAINTEPNQGSLWRYESSGDAVEMVSGVHIANGLGWSPDYKTFYFTDSGPRTIWAYDFDLEAGTLGERRVFAQIEPHEGVPDGMCVDSEGCVWTALWDGWSVRRYRPDGTIERTINVPVPRPTSCTFGGPDLTTLYVTSARIRLSTQQLEDAPLSGSVLAIQTNVKGQPDIPFAG